MKILHVISSLDKGGAETHLAMLLKSQVKNNFVKVIYFKGNSFWKKKILSFGSSVTYYPFKNLSNLLEFVKTYFFLKKEISNFKPDIVHGHLSSAEIILSILKFFNFRLFKLIITKHLDSFFLEGSRGKNIFYKGILIDKFIFNISDKIIFISEFTKRYFLNKIKVNSEKFVKIYYGFDKTFYQNTRNYKKKLLRKIKYKKGEIIISNVSRHVKQKSIDTFLKTISILEKKYKLRVKVFLAGRGPETKNLKKLAKHLKLTGKIYWYDNYNNIKDIYKISDLFFLTSKYEGLGLVLLEAISFKLPIIASKESSIPEVVKENINGILAKDTLPETFAKKIFNLTNNKKLFQKLSNNPKNILDKKFNYKRMCDQTLNLYKKAVKLK